MSDVAGNRPPFSPDDAIRIAREHWGIAGTAIELPSDRDQNFRIQAESESVVLKIASAAEQIEVLQLQNDVLEWLADLDLTSRVLPANNGDPIVVVQHEAQGYFVRLVSWLPGTPLAVLQPHSDELLREFGEVLGRMDLRLATFTNEARPTLSWDLKNAFDVFDANGQFVDESNRALFDDFIARFTQITQPQLSDLREGWVQGDANDHNVLVAQSDLRSSVAGLIDFGDMTHSWIVGEVAIACAYAMFDKSRPLAAAVQIVCGYHSVFPLEEREVAVLFDLICMRLCVSVAMSARQKVAEPDNEYLSVSEGPAWRLLEQLANISPDFAIATLRHACGFEPCPNHQPVTAWLAKQDFHPLVGLDCSETNVFVHDLSVSSSEPATASLDKSVEQFTHLLDQERERHGKLVGFGRYDEPRLCYASDQFATAGTVRRTVHIGLDIFAGAGTQVFAPLAGTVHSVANNDLPLDYGPTIILRHETDDGIEFFTLFGHLSEESIQNLKPGDSFQRGDELATFGDATVNGGWPPHVHFQIMTNMLGKVGDFPGVAPPDEREVWLSLVPDPNLIAQLNIPGTRCEHTSSVQMHDCRSGLLGPSLSLSYRKPLHIVRGADKYLYDELGRAYLDTVNNVAHVGHCHPRVVAAGQRQMGVLNTNTRYLHDSILRYSERLAAKFPDPLEVVFLVCSGSEANELAMRMARAHTSRADFIVLDSGYHGNTAACVDVSAYKFDGNGGQGAPAHVHKVRTPDPYRITEFKDGDVAAEDVAKLIAAGNAKPAAFLHETIASCGGQIVPPHGYLDAAYEHVRGAGGVCIADEVQTGFGRVGTDWWAFETQSVVPDIVTMGKPIGNGHPIGAVITTRAIAESFANGMEFFNTFGGNAVSCEIAASVLDVVEDEGLRANAADVGAFFLGKLGVLGEKHSLIGDVRGRGLFLGVEFVRDRKTKEPAAAEASYIVERLKQNYILASTDGPLHNVIKIKPPMTFGREDAGRYCEFLDEILHDSILKA